MVYLKAVSVSVDLLNDTFRFVIQEPLQAPFLAEAEDPKELPRELKPYAKISLISTNIIAANNELRQLVRPLGRLNQSVFEYKETSKRGAVLHVQDTDPRRHRLVDIGCYTYNLRKGDIRSEAFRAAIANCDFVIGVPDWKNVELVVTLRPRHNCRLSLLETFAHLASLLP